MDKIWLHVLSSVKTLFLTLLLGLFLVDRLAPYVSLGIFTLIMIAVMVVIPSMVAVWISHSPNPEMHWLPSVIIFLTGTVMVVVLALGCDVGLFRESCHGGFAGPLVVLGVMMSWAGITFAFGIGSYKKMLRHGRVK